MGFSPIGGLSLWNFLQLVMTFMDLNPIDSHDFIEFHTFMEFCIMGSQNFYLSPVGSQSYIVLCLICNQIFMDFSSIGSQEFYGIMSNW